MKLVDIVKYLKDEQSFTKFLDENNYPKQAERILIYMRDSLELDSDLFFFNEHETGDNLIFEKEGSTYHQLLPLELGFEFYSYFDEFFSINKYTDPQKAQRILEYVKNDA